MKVSALISSDDRLMLFRHFMRRRRQLWGGEAGSRRRVRRRPYRLPPPDAEAPRFPTPTACRRSTFTRRFHAMPAPAPDMPAMSILLTTVAEALHMFNAPQRATN